MFEQFDLPWKHVRENRFFDELRPRLLISHSIQLWNYLFDLGIEDQLAQAQTQHFPKQRYLNIDVAAEMFRRKIGKHHCLTQSEDSLKHSVLRAGINIFHDIRHFSNKEQSPML